MPINDSLEFTPGQNCWRVERASSFSFIIDGQDYFRALREALLKAERCVIMVGWDFDFEIEMLPGESDGEGLAPDGLPNQVGPFLEALVDRRSGLDIYLLKWSGGALIAPGGTLPAARIKLLAPAQIHLAFDGRHPIGACHHQKIAVIDDALAFCGGIDMTDGRWDRPAHQSDDPLRQLKSGEAGQPWHDASAVLSGPAAAALSKLARDRWARANDKELDEDFDPVGDRWPESIAPALRDVDIAIARTEPPGRDSPTIAEIERLYLDSIAAARNSIYLESQYFCSDSISKAIAARLLEPNGPEIIVINPFAAQQLVEDQAMHVTRSRMIRGLQVIDRENRFRILYPVNDAGEPIYVHAKISIIDDTVLRVGSSNIDRRSMAFDTECDVALTATEETTRDYIRGLRDRLLSEHLGCEPDDVAQVVRRTGSVISAIDALGHEGRGLQPLPLRKENLLGSFLADTRLFDPRYRHSAQARLGITSRHVMIGGVALIAGAVLWRRFATRRKS
ncbi:phospholipase D-like domain-containing protein [Paracoccus aestuariivivens]|uniref:Phospholipase D n=1 Tax=Paracoccus aestuariivivens TaxID=1820333 RepID=A0A6L6J4F3_9RHOB|nr:phospholipase D-like domain-containing protein [Paracoccus aestuariivivens]MTH76962.1 phospholipase [Paracoccus aestuariivivens]